MNSALDAKDDSDVSHESVDAGEYLLKLRICTILDIIGLLYRSAVPFPLWFHFFATSSHFGVVLKVLYTALKLMDVTRKAHACMVAIEFFIKNKIVSYLSYTRKGHT